ncbi:EAL domain-containing protein [Pseudomonas sp. IT-P258]|uniref:EAL domain-containing protein n=1 Tax=Pseudomonas sp. IT-P258 TaxID=3026447 RepID=UPI0039DFF50A
MLPLTALILQNPGVHRSSISALLHHLDFGRVVEMTSNTVALEALRKSGGVTLLLWDLRTCPAVCLDFLLSVAREHLARTLVIIGEPAKGAWPALKRLLSLHGLHVLQAEGAGAIPDGFAEVLAAIKLRGAITPKSPILRETPADEAVVTALWHGEIRPAFQPKVSVKTGRICEFEVLARWQRPDGDLLAPDQFLPALRDAGLLDALLFTLLGQAFSKLSAQGHTTIKLAFNLEPSQISRPGFAVRVEQWLRRLGVDPRRITFELTELGLLEAPEVSLENLLRLRMLGCGLAIDDFGSGQSTLQRLVELPFTELKLDACFVQELHCDPRRRAVLSNAVSLGRALELSVVAEGVETESQLRQLEDLGCDYVQGYYFSKAVMGDALEHLLRSPVLERNDVVLPIRTCRK